MSRRELVCPECETPARPTLIEPPPEIYTCETCKKTFPRKFLRRRTIAHKTIGGRVPSVPPTVVGGATSQVWDPIQATPSLTSGNFPVAVGDVVVGMVSSLGTAGAPDGQVAISDGGSLVKNMTKAVEVGTALGRFTSIWFCVSPFSGSAIAFTAEWLAPFPLSATVIGTVLRGCAASPLDKTAAAKGTSATPATGSTGALSQVGEIAIACFGTSEDASNDAPAWALPFLGAQRDGTSHASNDTTLSEARASGRSAAPLNASGTIIDPVDWAACVATFKGA